MSDPKSVEEVWPDEDQDEYERDGVYCDGPLAQDVPELVFRYEFLMSARSTENQRLEFQGIDFRRIALALFNAELISCKWSSDYSQMIAQQFCGDDRCLDDRLQVLIKEHRWDIMISIEAKPTNNVVGQGSCWWKLEFAELVPHGEGGCENPKHHHSCNDTTVFLRFVLSLKQRLLDSEYDALLAGLRFLKEAMLPKLFSEIFSRNCP